MNLIIDTTATDLSNSAVTAIGSVTPVDAIADLCVGDNAALSVAFTAGLAGIPAWAGAMGYVLSVGIGILDVDGLADMGTSVLATPITGGWSGFLNLTSLALYDDLKLQVGTSVDMTRFPLDTRVPRSRPRGGYYFIQVRITDPSGNETTYAVLRVFVRNRVIPS